MIFDIFAKEKDFYKGVILPVSSGLPAINHFETKPSPSEAGCGGRLSEPE